MSRWIEFLSVGLSASGKTAVVMVTPKDGSPPIGTVKWYGAWRKYAFFPSADTVFEQDCLRDIAAFCETATRNQRALHRETGVGVSSPEAIK